MVEKSDESDHGVAGARWRYVFRIGHLYRETQCERYAVQQFDKYDPHRVLDDRV